MSGYSGYEDWSVAGWGMHLPGVADPRQFASGLGDETIPAMAAAAADRAPGRVAVTSIFERPEEMEMIRNHSYATRHRW